MRILVIAALVFAGCGSETARPPRPSGRTLIVGPHPSLPGPLHGLTFDRFSEATKAIDGLNGNERTGVWVADKTLLYINPLETSASDPPIASVMLVLAEHPEAEIKSWLVAAWGPPDGTQLDDIWFAPSAGLRVTLRSDMLTYQPMMTIAELVGQPGKPGFERIPLIGARLEDLKTAYGGWLDVHGSGEPVVIHLRPIAGGSMGSRVTLRLVDDIVVGYRAVLMLGSDATDQATVAAALAPYLATSKAHVSPDGPEGKFSFSVGDWQ